MIVPGVGTVIHVMSPHLPGRGVGEGRFEPHIRISDLPQSKKLISLKRNFLRSCRLEGALVLLTGCYIRGLE